MTISQQTISNNLVNYHTQIIIEPKFLNRKVWVRARENCAPELLQFYLPELHFYECTDKLFIRAGADFPKRPRASP